MTLKSKLPDNYGRADPSLWLIGAWEELDPIFAGRLSYAARANGCRIIISEGHRSTERQAYLYKQYLIYKQTGKGTIKLAAKPGTSKHEFRIAVDTSTYPIRGMSNVELAKYGLYKPIASEPWHIEPIETKGLTTARAKLLMPEEVADLTRDETLALIKEVLAGKDTEVSSWAKEDWEEATKQGITDGTRPGGYCTREQVATMLLRGKE